LPTLFISRPKVTLPSAVRQGNSCAKSWNTTPRSLAVAFHRLAADLDHAAGRLQEARDDVEQRGFAAAGRPDDAENSDCSILKLALWMPVTFPAGVS